MISLDTVHLWMPLSAFVFLMATGLLADTHYVDKFNGAGASSPYTSWATAATGIQDAIDASDAGDTVLVSNGVYVSGSRLAVAPGLLSNRVEISKAITVMAVSTNPADTVISGAPDPGNGTNGPSAIRCVYLCAGSSLVGFTLSNGYVEASSGNTWAGGAYCANNTTCILSNSVIRACHGARFGSGVYQGVLYNCLVAENSSCLRGGGCYQSRIISSTISNNYAPTGGGGYYCIVSESLVISNRADYGGGLQAGSVARSRIFNNWVAGGGAGLRGAQATNCLIVGNWANGGLGGGMNGGGAVNCTIVSNRAGNGGGIAQGNMTAVNCIIYFNIAANNPNCPGFDSNPSYWVYPSWTCVTPTNNLSDAGPGLITNAPAFVDPAGGDYSLTAGSPCVNAGTNLDWMTDGVDFCGARRIDRWYGKVDMGAYEFTASGVMFLGY